MTTTLDKPKTQSTHSKAPSRKPSNVFVRAATGMVILPIVVFVILWGGWVAFVPLCMIGMIAILEFYFMERHRSDHNNALMGGTATLAIFLAFQLQMAWLWQGAIVLLTILSFVAELQHEGDMRRCLQRVLTSIAGVFYVAFPFAFFIAIRQVEPFGIHWAFSVIFATWGTDTLAYIFGKMFGKHAFVPRLSPNKTWEGVIGGVTFGAVLPMLVLMRVDALSVASAMMCVVAAFAAIGGDVFESMLKRYFGVKDSHISGFNVLPGHGGALDRVDAMIFVLVVHYIFLVSIGEIPLLI